MICRCARCQYEGWVHNYYDWYKDRRKSPQLWLCDVCANEVAR